MFFDVVLSVWWVYCVVVIVCCVIVCFELLCVRVNV